jgi:hypothetical protein
MIVNAVVVWLLVFTTGASLSRLIVSDKLSAGLRDRWEAHWTVYTDRTLAAADRELQIVRNEPTLEGMGKLRHEIRERAVLEPGAYLWTRRRDRLRVRPWSTLQEDLDRYAGYAAFITCRWCAPIWVYLLCSLWTWGRVFGFSFDVLAPAAVPLDWFALAFLLTARWVYGLVDMNLGDN